jgi:hypothetical protein
VLEVVHDDEGARTSGQTARERVGGQLALLLVDAERSRDARDHEGRIGQGGEVDERSATQRRGGRHRETRLAGASGARQRDEPRVVAPEQGRDRGELEMSPDQLHRGSRGWRHRMGRRWGQRLVVLEDAPLQRTQLG